MLYFCFIIFIIEFIVIYTWFLNIVHLNSVPVYFNSMSNHNIIEKSNLPAQVYKVYVSTVFPIENHVYKFVFFKSFTRQRNIKKYRNIQSIDYCSLIC